MIKKDGEVLFDGMKGSVRSLEDKELINLINASCISRQALQRMTGNQLKNLAKMEKKKKVKVESSNALSPTSPRKYYFNKNKKEGFNTGQASRIDLISYAVYALRQYKMVGQVQIEENGNALADMVIDEENYSTLEFISLDVQTYKRKIQMLENNNLQKVLVIDGNSLYKNITDNYKIKTGNLILVVDDKNVKLTYQALEKISETFDFKKLKHQKSTEIVEKIKSGYNKSKKAKRNSPLKNVNKQKESE